MNDTEEKAIWQILAELKQNQNHIVEQINEYHRLVLGACPIEIEKQVSNGMWQRLDDLEKLVNQMVEEWIKEKERHLKWQRSVEEKVLRALHALEERFKT